MESKMSDLAPQTKRSDGSSNVPPPSPSDPKPRRGLGWVLWLVIGIIIVIAGILLLHHPKQSESSAQSHGHGRGGGATGPAMVSTATAQSGDIGVYVNALGSVTPLNVVSVNSRIEGQITKISYEEGQFVKKGDPLLVIDPGPNQAALLQAQGQLERDSALLEDARLDLQRYQEAFASNAIPKQQLDTQVATVHQDEGTVKLDQGELDNAQVQLGYCYITAPIAGRTGLRLVDEGNIVQAGSTNLVVITQLQPISVIFDVAEDYLPQIEKQLRQGRKLVVDVFDRAMQNKLATGTLETLDNQINPTTGTVQFRAIFTNDDLSLFPNQFVNARLLVNTLSNVTLLPNTVIQRNSDSAFVYKIGPPQSDQTNQDQTAAQTMSDNSTSAGTASTNAAPANHLASAMLTTITVGTTDGNVSEIEGIDPGTVVVADNFNKLTDGATVIVRPSTGSTNETRQARHKRKKKVSQ
jgi:multidrug efflux system membrane fusion protein